MSEPLPLLTPEERAIMLHDIARVALAVGGGAADLDVSAGSLRACHCPAERLGFIEHALPELAAVQEAIRHAPIITARQVAHPVAPPIRARRVTPQALLAAVRRGEADRRLIEHYPVYHADTPENRAALSFLACLRRDGEAIARMADAAGDAEIRDRAIQTTRRLRGMIADPLWEKVARHTGAWTLPPTEKMQSRPAYAPFARLIVAYRKAFQFDWASPLFSLPARDTWQLYEAWTLFQTLNALLMPGSAVLWQTAWAIREDRLWLTLATGDESRIRLTLPNGRLLTVTYNETFAAGERSRSHAMRPDITLTDSAGTIWILDAKFKAYDAPGDEGDDINQMHGYRDGIVSATGLPPVAQAWCLFPGRSEGRREIVYAAAYAGEVGALRLRPGCAADARRLTELVTGWIRPEQAREPAVPAPP